MHKGLHGFVYDFFPNQKLQTFTQADFLKSLNQLMKASPAKLNNGLS